MNQVLKTMIFIVVSTTLYLGMVTLFNSCKNGKNVEEIVVDTSEQAGEDIAEYFEEDQGSQGSTIDLSQDNEFGEVEQEATIKSEKENTYQVLDEEPRTDYTQSENSKYRAPSTVGKHMVVAGNFSVEGNARNMIKKLSNMGYNSAQQVTFDYSSYYTVLAYRGNDYNEALEVSNELKRNGIDNYITTQK